MFLLWGIIETTALTLMFGMSPISAHVPFFALLQFLISGVQERISIYVSDKSAKALAQTLSYL
jgi:hypothetical protein